MTSTLLRRLGPLLLGGSCCARPRLRPRSAEELRIGYLAPTTGIFAQVGKDMVDGFKMYLDEKNDKFGGAEVKFIVEDEQGKPDTAVTKAKKLILQDKVHIFVGGLLASTGYALAPVSTAEKVVYISSGRRRPTTSPSATCRSIRISSAPAGRARSRAIRSANGPASRATRRSSPSPPTSLRLRGGRRLPARVRGLRRADRPEDLAAARHQGLRALHPDPQGGRRRDLHRSWSARCRCNSPSSWRRPATRSR